MTTIDDIRRRLRGEEKGFLAKYSERVSRLERLRPWFAGIGVLGALVAAISRVIEGPLGLGLTIAGAVLAAGGGALVVLMDYKKLEIAREAQAAHELAEEALGAAEDAEARRLAEMEKTDQAKGALREVTQNAIALDRQRRSRLLAMRGMIETVEAALLRKEDAQTTAEKMLNVINEHLRQAVGVEASDDFSISIFRREPLSTHVECMRRIGCYSTVAKEREYDDVFWKKGRGYTGTLWHEATVNRDAKLILPDTTLPELRERYPVDAPDLVRDARYLSVACYPILIQRTQNVWGVVTAAINRRNVFARIDDRPTQGVELVEDIAYVAALLAGLNGPGQSTGGG